ncbi:hypothetical protein GCM10028791_37270 [Echinicola sediminis]
MEDNRPIPHFTMPMRGLILIAGMFTVAWGAFFKWFGEPLLSWLAMEPESTFDLSTNFYGSFVLIIGFVLFLSAFYPISWTYMTMIGIGGKLISAIWFALYYADTLGWNKRTIFHVGFNELLWLLPLSVILLRALKVKAYLKSLPED